MVIRDERIVAAACILQLSEDYTISRELGTRHRAAIGITAVSYTHLDVYKRQAGTLADTLGKRNPFRYRGYVFDEETGLYLSLIHI